VLTVPEGQAFDDALLGQELVSLKRIVDVLRVECPWDREQTPRDIIGYTIEEVHELADAVHVGDLAAEHGELGDLLLQVVLLALMLDEEGAGDLASVAHDIEVKLIRRHPHIFADAVAETPKDVKSRWERIKVEQEGRQGIFHDVPAGFPALLYAKKLQQRAASVGFDWDSAAEAFPKIAEEHAELAELFREAAEAETAAAEAHASVTPAPPSPAPSASAGAAPASPALADPQRADPRVAHEVGDLLFATVNVARLLHVDPELALREAGNRFERRVTKAAELAAAQGEDWTSLGVRAQEAYYQRAKAGED
jgi:MazG family protein